MPTRPNAFGPTMHGPGPYPHAGGGGGGGGGHAPHNLHGHFIQQQQQERFQAAHYHGQQSQLAQAQAAQAQAQAAAAQAQQQQQHQQARQEQAAKAAAVAAQQAQQQAHHAHLAHNQLMHQQQRSAVSTTPAGPQLLGGGIPVTAHAVATAQASAAAQAAATAAAQAAVEEACIVNVWQSNLDQEIAKLRDLVDTYKYISMDTEFPGIVARPMGTFKNKADYHYQTLRCNVDMLKIIQLGITLADEEGNSPEVCTWQFNFKFSLQDDMYAQDSIELLTKSGIDFSRHAEHGIDVFKFGELLISSGLVLIDDVHWISFHSGYDFGYLVKIMMCKPLPSEESEFRAFLSKFFPSLYDIKFLMKSCKGLKGGLQDIADELQIPRIGPQHQAGSDSMLTGSIFFCIKKTFFGGKIDDEKYLGQVWGLNLGTTNGVGGGVIYNSGGPSSNAAAGNNNNASSSSEQGKDAGSKKDSGANNPPTTPTSSTPKGPSTPAPQQQVNGGAGGPSTPGYSGGGYR